MRNILLMLLLLPQLARGAEVPLTEQRADLKAYVCHRLFYYALNACSSDPWSCQVSAPYKNGFRAWSVSHLNEIKAQQAQIKNAHQSSEKILHTAMNALAEDARRPTIPGKLAAMASSCGVARLAPAPSRDEAIQAEIILSRELRR